MFIIILLSDPDQKVSFLWRGYYALSSTRPLHRIELTKKIQQMLVVLNDTADSTLVQVKNLTHLGKGYPPTFQHHYQHVTHVIFDVGYEFSPYFLLWFWYFNHCATIILHSMQQYKFEGLHSVCYYSTYGRDSL